MITTAGINYLIDPFGIYHENDLVSFSSNKIGLSRHARFAKPAMSYFKKPDAVILGTSRSDYGLSPTLLMQLGEVDNAYNLSMAGLSIKELNMVFEHIVATTSLKTAVIGLDFFMFNIYKSTKIDKNELAYNNVGDYQRNMILKSLLSYDALKSSIRTIKKRNSLSSYDKRGQRNSTKRIPKILSHDRGYFDVFEKTIDLFFKEYWFGCGSMLGTGYSVSHEGHNTYKYIKLINQLAERYGIKIIYVIAPNHAHLYEAMSAAGLWPLFVDWKRNLLMAVDDNEEQYISLWDFSGYNQFTEENLPELKDEQMLWHLEPSHYTSVLGEVVLKRIFSNNVMSFGLKLNKKNIENHLSDINLRQLKYRKKYPEVFSKYKSMYLSSIGKRNHSHQCVPVQIN